MFSFKASQLNRFWYWINERHRIYLKRQAGDKFPWTKDKILREYKFTNVYRQLDKVTKEWEQRYISRLGSGKKMKDGDLLFELIKFRIFNWPETYDVLHFNMRKWDRDRAVEVLKKAKEEGKQLFTGAYIVTSGGSSDPKYETICDALNYAYEQRNRMAGRIRRGKSMQEACEILRDINTVGPFVAYEMACDLRFTRILSDAKDIMSWANPGPGAKRGIHRLLTGHASKMSPAPDYVAVMRHLLTLSHENLDSHVFECIWPFEMREIEHSLCEFDKYMRVKNDEGRPRSKYSPPPPQLGLFSMLPDDEDPEKAK